MLVSRFSKSQQVGAPTIDTVSVSVLVLAAEKVALANAAAEAAALAELAYYPASAAALADFAQSVVPFLLDDTNTTRKAAALLDLLRTRPGWQIAAGYFLPMVEP